MSCDANASMSPPSLPQAVEEVINKICEKQNQPRLSHSTRRELASLGQEKTLTILHKVETMKIHRSFDGLVIWFINQEREKSKITGSPQSLKHLSPSPPFQYHHPQNQSPVRNGIKATRLIITPQGGDDAATRFPSLEIDRDASMCVETSTQTQETQRQREENLSPQLVALGELEFRKAFLVLNYVGSSRLEEVLSADQIRKWKNLGMDHFERTIWDSFGHRCVNTEDRCKSFQWDLGMTYMYHCYVSPYGSCKFKGPYLEQSKTHLQKVLGDDNVLMVKFAEGVNDIKSLANWDYFANKILDEGILVGLRRYKFFVFKDGGKEARKKDPTTSSVKCFFVRMESNASIDQNQDYVLSGKTVQEARRLFMHVHTLSSVSNYMARFSLILSKTIKLDIDLADVNIERIEDIYCQDKDGNYVYDKDGKPCIHTDGTGFISDDLALRCPENVLKEDVLRTNNLEDEFSGMKNPEYHYREPPLLIQFRLFDNGFAVKGTVLVNKKLPPKTIQVRPSMIKVETDPNVPNISKMNSFEVIKTGRLTRRKTCISRQLIALLSYGGVPQEFFLDILQNILEGERRAIVNKRAALRVALNQGWMGDLAARMILSGIPLNESFLQCCLSKMLEKERESLKAGKLPISESFYLMGTADPTGELEGDEVSIILENGQISGEVLVYRNPGLHFGDIRVLKARYVKSMEDFVGNAKYAIFFPCKGARSLADMMAKGDFDGDTYFISRNAQLLHYFKESEPWTSGSPALNVLNRRPSEFAAEELEQELFKLFLKTRFQQSFTIGVAADSWLAIMDRLLTRRENVSTEETVLMKENMLRLIDIYYDAVDAPKKSGKKIEVPENLKPTLFPHYMERQNSFKSTSILGKIYDMVKSFSEEDVRIIDIQKLPCLEGGFSEESKMKWTVLYEQYRKHMTDILNVKADSSKEQTEEATNELINKYKQMLYDASDLEESLRPLKEIYDEARAIYNVVYDYAIKCGDAEKCRFAWRTAGSALFRLYAREQGGEKPWVCAVSILKEVLN